MGGRSGGGDQVKTRRYAGYIEDKHSNFLDTTVFYRNAVIDNSPFADYDPVEANNAFFGIGYALSNFPSLYDMFGKHMAGLDIEELWNSVFEKTLNRPEIETVIQEEVAIADEKMSQEFADYQVNMRNMNAVSSSSYVIGKAVLEDKRIKTLASVRLEANARFFPDIGKNFAVQLNWMKSEITTYAGMVKAYFIWKTDMDEGNYTFAARNALWPFTVLSFEGAALGVMQTKTPFSKMMTPRKRSAVSGVLLVASYAVTGAYIGSSWGPYGTVIGAVIGFVIGVAMWLLE